jgi:hypothetical protein
MIKHMNILPKADEVVIPPEKFYDYVLNLEKDANKAIAFETALGYNIQNASELIKNIKSNLKRFPAEHKGHNGYGEIYAVLMELKGVNGKTAKVVTAWIDDDATGKMRLVNAYVKKRRGCENHG